MANNGPKTERGKVREILTGDGRKKTETGIREGLENPVAEVDKALGKKRKNQIW